MAARGEGGRRRARDLVDARGHARVRPARATTGCRRSASSYKVPHYDAKGEANQLFTDAGVPTTFLQTSFYWENFIYFGMGPQRGDDGSLTLTFPIGSGRVAGHRRRGHRRLRLRDLQGRHAVHRHDRRRSPAST